MQKNMLKSSCDQTNWLKYGWARLYGEKISFGNRFFQQFFLSVDCWLEHRNMQHTKPDTGQRVWFRPRLHLDKNKIHSWVSRQRVKKVGKIGIFGRIEIFILSCPSRKATANTIQCWEGNGKFNRKKSNQFHFSHTMLYWNRKPTSRLS